MFSIQTNPEQQEFEQQSSPSVSQFALAIASMNKVVRTERDAWAMAMMENVVCESQVEVDVTSQDVLRGALIPYLYQRRRVWSNCKFDRSRGRRKLSYKVGLLPVTKITVGDQGVRLQRQQYVPFDDLIDVERKLQTQITMSKLVKNTIIICHVDLNAM